ncbi:MAG: GNAT family N-acetyltransferase [Candidatus Zixiibacteriota bacterium]|nr:MAG: GNAT family N-acetyltransferase [candidate division Zixibacteria bacterium]
MQFKCLTTEMLSFRLGHDPEIDPDWFVAHLDDIIRYNPDGCFALCDDDRVIGMVTSTVYEQTGWLGWLFVLQEYRGQGLGAKLMKKAIDHVQSRGIKTMLLEAVVEAVTLYRRLGFVEQFHTQHYLLSPDNLAPASNQVVETSAVAAADVETLAAFDRRFFNEDRQSLFQIVFGNANFRGYIARSGTEIVGFLITTEAAENQQVSPMIVNLSHPRAADAIQALVAAALKACPKPLYFRCPLLTEGYGDTLTGLGATKVDYHTVRMYLGEPYKTEQKGMLSLGCPGKG